MKSTAGGGSGPNEQNPITTPTYQGRADSAKGLDHWVHHLIAPDEVINGEVNPSAISENLRAFRINGVTYHAISGRVLSKCKGTIRSFAAQRCKAPSWKFHGIVVGEVAMIKLRSAAEVFETPAKRDPAHASLCFRDVPTIDGLPTLRFAEFVVEEVLDFVAAEDPKFVELDRV